MQPFLIDTHAHVYLPEFDKDRSQMILRAQSAGVTQIFLPAIDSSTHGQMLETEAAYPICKSMMGLHPCSVQENYSQEIEAVKNHLAQRRFIAVGEIGLDFYWDKTFVRQQYAAFEQQIELALAYNLPVVIHSRNAIDECIGVVAKHPSLRGVFHCFSGTEAQAGKLIKLGFFLGIGGVVTFKNAGLDKVISAIGLSSVVLETDAPYLAPVPYRGKRNEPAYTKTVAEKIASLLNISLEEVFSTTSTNAEKLFSFAENL
ncbi:TatD family hydrolase [Flavisolibacter ginsenosidimutans]|uniref:TatD family deoxyribonuclease n=1 Tax=Flavisolibacter ginsenosidimutans TaxID=661481 RepID=A0A5B8UJG8_9BACT|nr:TatD family hydrolase [Flavisolibacter ginsenosidimutans]QEC56837.1 TatD family deoxyribonuclease [Flavisolibacter ginsenosidimutans]